MDDGQQTYRVLRLVVDNFKRLTAADVSPGRNTVIVTGRNAAGKSSLLDSLASTLGGKKQLAEQPVHTGAESGTILVVLGDDKGELLVKRTFSKDGKTALEITAAGGFKAPSPQAILDAMCGAISFDPLLFTRQKPQEQVETLRGLVGIDFTELDTERKRLYDERTQCNKNAKSFAAQAEGITFPDDTPSEAISVSDLMVEQRRLLAVNAANQRERDKIGSFERDTQEAERLVQRSHDAIAILERQLVEAKETLQRSTEHAERTQLVLQAHQSTINVLRDEDVNVVQMKIVNAQAINNNVAKSKQKRELLLSGLDADNHGKQITDKINAIDAEKERQLSSVKWPIEGLAFGDAGVLYRNVPLSQASGAELIEVSFSIVAAMNPRLKVALIRDASLLDEDQMKVVYGLAERYDMQVWLECVSTEGGDARILIEDGAVVSGGTENAEPIEKKKRKKKATAPVVQSDLPFGSDAADTIAETMFDDNDPFME